MAINDYAQAPQCFFYLISFSFSLTILIPMIMNVTEFRNNCLLFTTGTFNESDGRILEPKWASFSTCALTIFTGLLLNIISLIQFIRSINLLSNRKTESIISLFWSAVIAFGAFLFTLIVSILVTVGFNKWCTTLTQNFESCEDAADSNVMIISGTDIKSDRFFLEMGAVDFGLWVSLISWFSVFIWLSLAFYEHHQKENIIISMARERRRYETIDEE